MLRAVVEHRRQHVQYSRAWEHLDSLIACNNKSKFRISCSCLLIMCNCTLLCLEEPIGIMLYDYNERTSTSVLWKACRSYSITFYFINGKYLPCYESQLVLYPKLNNVLICIYFQITSNWKLTGDKKNPYITMIVMAKLFNYSHCTELCLLSSFFISSNYIERDLSPK